MCHDVILDLNIKFMDVIWKIFFNSCGLVAIMNKHFDALLIIGIAYLIVKFKSFFMKLCI